MKSAWPSHPVDASHYAAIKKYLLNGILVLVVVAGGLCGCRHSTESVLDDRTLKDKPHVETVYPENRADPFRP